MLMQACEVRPTSSPRAAADMEGDIDAMSNDSVMPAAAPDAVARRGAPVDALAAAMHSQLHISSLSCAVTRDVTRMPSLHAPASCRGADAAPFVTRGRALGHVLSHSSLLDSDVSPDSDASTVTHCSPAEAAAAGRGVAACSASTRARTPSTASCSYTVDDALTLGVGDASSEASRVHGSALRGRTPGPTDDLESVRSGSDALSDITDAGSEYTEDTAGLRVRRGRSQRRRGRRGHSAERHSRGRAGSPCSTRSRSCTPPRHMEFGAVGFGMGLMTYRGRGGILHDDDDDDDHSAGTSPSTNPSQLGSPAVLVSARGAVIGEAGNVRARTSRVPAANSDALRQRMHSLGIRSADVFCMRLLEPSSGRRPGMGAAGALVDDLELGDTITPCGTCHGDMACRAGTPPSRED